MLGKCDESGVPGSRKKKRPPGKPERRAAKIKIIFLIFFAGRKPFFRGSGATLSHFPRPS
jgi:hypothetical protein